MIPDFSPSSGALNLVEVLAAPPQSVADVIACMQRIDALLPSRDGLKWFNLLYLRVTEAVRERLASPEWEDRPWLDHLDVIFAQLYFEALATWQSTPEKVRRAWWPLLRARLRKDIMPLQFALAGMNAHINHDLPIAVVETCRQRRTRPLRSSAQRRDFERVNAILEAVEQEVKQFLVTGLVGVADVFLGEADDVAAMWSVRKARETAWNNALILWRLRPLPPVREDFLLTLDRLVGLASRGMLTPLRR